MTTANLTNTTVTSANMTGLSFPIAANEIITFEAYVKCSCSSTGGVKFDLTTPAGATVQVALEGNTSAVTAYSTVFLTAASTQSAAFMTAAITGLVWIQGTIVNSSTAGTVQLRFAAGTASQTATIFANSYLTARKSV